MSDLHWLDKHIAEQAAYYGQSVEQHAMFVRDAAAVLTPTEN